MTESLLSTEEIDDLFIKPKKKYKILFLGDHICSTSGVGVASRFLLEGLAATGKYSFRCLGGAIKHSNYNTVSLANNDIIVKPVDGFGTKELIRSLLITERPDAVMLITDPRQFMWLFEIEDEIHNICPIAYWTIWDNGPFPTCNIPWYKSCDLLNCISKKTYDLLSPVYPEKTNYIPHAFPKHVYYPLPEEECKQLSAQNFGARADWFKVLWVNRNAQRKMPGDVLDSFKLFLDNLEEKHGHRNAVLIMHTDPHDAEGPNLLSMTEMLGLQNNVWFSTEKLQFDKMNILHNLADCVLNISRAEGFGLSSLLSLQVGKPVVVLKTGGETDKVIDSRDGTELGVGINPKKTALVGSQLIPCIREDYADQSDVAVGLMKIYEMPEAEKKTLSEKCKNYVDYAFNLEDVVDKWDETLTDCIEKYKEEYKSWEVVSINPSVTSQPVKQTKAEISKKQFVEAVTALNQQTNDKTKSKSKKKNKNKKFKKNKK